MGLLSGALGRVVERAAGELAARDDSGTGSGDWDAVGGLNAGTGASVADVTGTAPGVVGDADGLAGRSAWTAVGAELDGVEAGTRATTGCCVGRGAFTDDGNGGRITVGPPTTALMSTPT